MIAPTSPHPTITAISHQVCVDLLNRHHVGRIAWQAADAPQILPVTYTMFEGRLYFRTAPESILSELLRPTPVVVEVDELDHRSRTGWSVVVHGRSRAVAEPAEVTRLWAVDPVPWAPGGRHLFIEVSLTQVTGRTVIRERS